MKKILLFFAMCFILVNSFAFVSSSVLLSDQGTDARDKLTGQLLKLGNLTIAIYDESSEGNLIFNQTYPNAIVNGSWNLMLSPALEFGNIYWKDYAINGEDLNFDGNDRIAFQSSLGKINNASFINFSLLNSCSEGSSIRTIYENGSVICEIDDSGSVNSSLDLTNYALKNQSETFNENITITQTGFFGWLGSLVSRITKLFVQDIDASGNIDVGNNVDVTGNITASYFIGDGSLLKNLSLITELGTANLHTSSILNITGVDDNACTGTDKIKNVTFNNGNLQIVCDMDNIGSSGIIPVYLNADVTSSSNSVYTSIFTIPLTPSKMNLVQVYLAQKTSTNGVAPQNRARISAIGPIGYCTFKTETSATAQNIDNIAVSLAPVDTGVTAFIFLIPVLNIVECSILADAGNASLIIDFQSETNTGNVTTSTGSYYTQVAN